MAERSAPRGRMYGDIVERLFLSRWQQGMQTVEFHRTDIETVAAQLNVKLPKNLGDLIYSFRFRRALPPSVVATAPAGYEWVIELHGGSAYRFALTRLGKVLAQPSLALIDIPDATPEIVLRYAQGDEQALLAQLRYNRLIDVFLGIVTYSLQNHLRTSIQAAKGRTQIEIDELYVGLDVEGEHFVVPVQAKGGSDRIGMVQAQQDVQFCAERFPDLKCRPVAAQFLGNGGIALFELTLKGDLPIKQERHYRLVDTEPYMPTRR